MITRKQLVLILLYQISTTSTAMALVDISSSQLTPQSKRKLTIETNCTRDLIEIKIDLGRKFNGILFAKDFLEECRTRGKDEITILKVPTAGCGVRSETKLDGSLEYSLKIMLQMDEKLRQSTDIKRIVKCILSPNMMNMELIIENDKDNGKILRTGRMRSKSTSTIPFEKNEISATPRVRIWLELGGNKTTEDSGAVQVGQATTLAIKAVLPGTIGIRVVDCSALDGLGYSSQELLDFRGCPWDDQVMPGLHTEIRPIEEGWSKAQEDDLVERIYEATFPAFKFPDRERLHVSCGVQLCRGNCPTVNCSEDVNNNGKISIEKQLARIEVFNSLAVTAPQIDELTNTMDKEYSPHHQILQEGTLCLSISNLALAFCILGLIFLVAVVFAIVCFLLRLKCRRIHVTNNESLQTISTSSDSGQSIRFGSKLLISHQGYGRVY